MKGETLVVDTYAEREFIVLGQLTRGPRMPACMRGVIELSGAVVPVIDL
ncbi:chemotaxis protein CheW [Pseudomonas rhizoryzae]